MNVDASSMPARLLLPAQSGTGDARSQAEQAMAKLGALASGAALRRLSIYAVDRAWLEAAAAVAGRSGVPIVGVVVAGLPDPEMLVAIEAEAGPDPAHPHPAGIDLPGLVDPAAADTVRRHGFGPDAAAAQADAVFARLRDELGRRGAAPTDLCKITMQIADRAYREPVYNALGRALSGVYPVSTGLIVPAFANPHALFQLDAYAVPGGPHERLRRYEGGAMPYGRGTQPFRMSFCMVVRAGNRLFVRGQTGMTNEGVLVGLGDPAAQARQAVENVSILLAEAGTGLAAASRLVIYVTDRAFLAPVAEEVLPAFPPSIATTALVVKGLAAPELLMEIDVHAWA